MDSSERTVDRNSRSSQHRDPGEGAESNVTMADAEVDQDVVEKFRALEGNTITETGAVLATVLADYDGGASPAAVQENIVSEIASRRNIEPAEAKSRLVSSSRSLLKADYSGRHAFLAVELPDGSIFLDRILFPDDKTRETPEVRRHRAFVDQYGSLDTLPQMQGERIPVQYDPADSRWIIAGSGDHENSQTNSIGKQELIGDIVSHLVTAAVLLFGFSVALSSSTTPIVGAVSVRTFLISILIILSVSFLSDLLQTSLKLAERVENA